jgi:hypothetical protein
MTFSPVSKRNLRPFSGQPRVLAASMPIEFESTRLIGARTVSKKLFISSTNQKTAYLNFLTLAPLGNTLAYPTC